MGCSNAKAAKAQEQKPAANSAAAGADRSWPTEASWIAPVKRSALRNRLVNLGETFSIEIGPADIAPVDGNGNPKKKGQSLLGLLAEAKFSGGKPPLRSHAQVYVNMVKPNLSHFDGIVTASRMLLDADLVPVPHFPVARFETLDEIQSVIKNLATAGAQQLLVLGGNDLVERVETGKCPYADGARGLLAAEASSFKENGINAVTLAGHPDGHPAFKCSVSSAEVLAAKARSVLKAGLKVAIATQFCFDARKLIVWLESTRRQMQQILAEENMASASGCVTYHIGLPGPTPRKKLERIAKICEVPSLFISSAFDNLDTNQDGVISLEELQEQCQKLGLGRKGSKLQSMYLRHAGADGLLQQDEFAQLLVEDAQRGVPIAGTDEQPKGTAAPQPTEASGPSVFLSGGDAGGQTSAAPEWVWPTELVLAIAGYCEKEDVPAGEVILHFFPFGGLAKTFELTDLLSGGSWPVMNDTEY